MIGVGGYAQTTHKNYPVADKPILAKAVEKKTTTHKKAPSKKAVASKKSSKKKSPTPKVQKPCINEFYAGYCLKPDSAVSPYLYYQVYDWLGPRYKYSGSSKNGIDCSGFVCEMYRNAYCVTLNGSSGSIYTQVKPVEKTELKEGDILFFKIRKKQISHVGVYLGNNKFAHASVHSGVIVSDLNEEYYKKYFFKGGRFLME
ncbi:MAG TPA: NlpC/P60 family protein [Bacteroidia bacterium]|nr:NlpC/P60 family protein [Bacteroidia bacterium]